MGTGSSLDPPPPRGPRGGDYLQSLGKCSDLVLPSPFFLEGEGGGLGLCLRSMGEGGGGMARRLR